MRASFSTWSNSRKENVRCRRFSTLEPTADVNGAQSKGVSASNNEATELLRISLLACSAARRRVHAVGQELLQGGRILLPETVGRDRL